MENLETTNTTTVEETGVVEEETVTMTKEELNALLQKTSDARVTQALKTQEKKNADKVREAEKLAKMSAEDKYVYELEQREKLLEERENQLALLENKNACSKILSEKGLSLGLVEFCVDKDADTMSERIKTLEREFKKSVKAEVEKRLGSNTPKQNLPMDTTITKEQFKQIKDASVLLDIKKNQPELWAELTK